MLTQIRELGKKAGVVLDPASPPELIEYVLHLCDIILVMTVNPGFGGQAFLPEMLPKIRRLRAMCTERGLDPVIEVDGGENVDDGRTSGGGGRHGHRRRLGDFRHQGLRGGHRGDPRERRGGRSPNHERGNARPGLNGTPSSAPPRQRWNWSRMAWSSGSAPARRRLSPSKRSPAPSPRLAFRRHSHLGTHSGAAQAAGIPLTSFGEHRQIDLTIDGADEVERGTLNLIKGLGGALLREKIVAAASRRLAIVVDGAKLVDRLGRARRFLWRSSPSGWRQPV